MLSRLIVILAFEGVTLLDVVAPADVFHVANMSLKERCDKPYEIKVASLAGGQVLSMSGVAISTVSLSSIDATDIDTIIVPGGGPPQKPPIPHDLVAWLKASAKGVRRLCGVCTGSFLLAAAGLLEGKRVTTHWQALKLLRETAKNLEIVDDSIFIRDGNTWTSAGFSTGTDLALALIEADEGYSKSVELAKTMVVYQKRSGSQSQLSAALASQEKSDSRFSKIHAFIVDNLTSNLTVEGLAEEMNMSMRSFVRKYKESLGCTPMKTVESIRLEHACDQLTTTKVAIKRVAQNSGFGSEQNMRRAFVRCLNVTPQAYRDTFSKS